MITEFSNYLIANPLALMVVLLWEVVWKGLGMWRAGRRNQPIWFVLILILNTAGILPIVYLLISKDKKKPFRKAKKKKR